MCGVCVYFHRVSSYAKLMSEMWAALVAAILASVERNFYCVLTFVEWNPFSYDHLALSLWFNCILFVCFGFCSFSLTSCVLCCAQFCECKTDLKCVICVCSREKKADFFHSKWQQLLIKGKRYCCCGPSKHFSKQLLAYGVCVPFSLLNFRQSILASKSDSPMESTIVHQFKT